VVLLLTETLLLQPDQTGLRGVSETGRESTSMRIVNTTMRELSGSFACREPIAFFCECHDPKCFGVVWMTADVFDATIAGHTGWMLLKGHEPSALWHTREPPPAPATRRGLRAVPDIPEEAPRPIRKPRSGSLHHRLARAS